MFKRIPMGLAALTFFNMEETQGVQLAKHRRHHDRTYAGLESIPNCTSYECKNNQAVLGYAGLVQTGFIGDPVMQSLAQDDNVNHSDPPFNSADGHYGMDTAAYPLAQTASIPACTSFECQKGTAAAPLMQVSSDSIPACTSFECQKGTAAAPLMQVSSSSDPICSSYHYPNCFPANAKEQKDDRVVYNADHDYPLDDDIVTSVTNMNKQEVIHKHKFTLPDAANVQLI